MIRFIWQNWWRRKERLILLLIGAFIISAGLTYLIGLSDTNRGTIVENLEQRWAASYDIVVRPEGSRSLTEDKRLLEPNYLSGLSGGISLEQYETIKEIPGVEVAAPIAMIGYASYEVDFGQVELTQDGLYRRQTTTIVDNGINEVTETTNYYFPINVWSVFDQGPEYGVGAAYIDLVISGESLLAGIDPEQEAKLVGLDEAILDIGASRYFRDTDGYHFNELKNYHEFPILVNEHAFVDKVEKITFERLELDINEENADEIMDEIKENGGAVYLDTLPGEEMESFTFIGEDAFHEFVSKMTGVDWETGEVYIEETDEVDVENLEQVVMEDGVTGIVYKPSPLIYEEISSPYADRWPFSYQVVPHLNGDDTIGVYRNEESYREPKLMADSFTELPRIKPNWIGFYDPSKLAISLDPTTELPMETYRPATAELVMDESGKPMNPPEDLQPIGDPYYFISDPPGMLTTIEAAEKLLGDEPISAIRIKVAGVQDLSEESQDILERVANEIESRTGLMTDITLGSSPQLALTYVPGLNGEEDLGWIQQPWVNIGSSISIFKETKIGFSSIVASVIVVAIIYVWASGIVNLLSRRKEFAVLLSIGWRPNQLNRLLFMESAMVGLFVTIISWTMLGLVYMSNETGLTAERFLLTGLFGLLIYLLGSIIPMWMTRNISPYEAMRTGEIANKGKRLFRAKGIFRMAFHHFIGKWKRSTLSVVAIALPTSLLALFIYITFRLKGIMYTSLLGEYVALEIGPIHYVAIVISMIIAMLTTAEILWQNVSERREEIALLQAIGWRIWSIRKLILAEGFFSGLFAAVFGLVVAFALIWGLYQEFPEEGIGFIFMTGFIPIVVGVLGTVLPAERAVRMTPHRGVSGTVTNRQTVEKRMKWALISVTIVLAATFTAVMVNVAPNLERRTSDAEVEEAFQPTEGDVVVSRDHIEETIEEDATDSDILQGDYLFELRAGESSENTSWSGILYYEVKEVESTLAEPETGMENIAIEVIFEIRDSMIYEMIPERHFAILDGEESYLPVSATIVEAVGWEDERWLHGVRDGKIHVVLEYTVPDTLEAFHFLLKNSTLGDGILVRFGEN